MVCLCLCACVCVLFGVLEVRSESPGDLDETERSLILIESRSRVVKLCPGGKHTRMPVRKMRSYPMLLGAPGSDPTTPIRAANQNDNLAQEKVQLP